MLVASLLFEIVTVVLLFPVLRALGNGDSDSSLDEMISGESVCFFFSFEAAVDFLVAFGFFFVVAVMSVDVSTVFAFLFRLPGAAVVTAGKETPEVGGGGWIEDGEVVEEVLGEVLADMRACDV